MELEPRPITSHVRNVSKLFTFIPALCSFTKMRVNQLLDLCLVFPPEGCDHARGHKLPFLASELFGYELNAIVASFFEEDEVSPMI